MYTVFGRSFFSDSLSSFFASQNIGLTVLSQHPADSENHFYVNYQNLDHDVVSGRGVYVIAIGNGDMDWAEQNPNESWRTHIEGLRHIISSLESLSVKNVIYVSTANVFSNTTEAMRFIRSGETPNPDTIYGLHKYEAEKMILAVSGWKVLRVPLLVSGLRSKKNLLYRAVSELLAAEEALKIDNFQTRYLTFVEDVGRMLLTKGFEQIPRVAHLSSKFPCTRFQLYQHVKRVLGVSTDLIPVKNYPVVQAGSVTARRSLIKLENNFYEPTSSYESFDYHKFT